MPYKDPEKRRQWQREYRKNNQENIAKKKAEYYKNNREKLAKKQAEYRKNNPEKIVKKQAKYYKNNQENIVKKLWFKKYGGTEEQYNHYLSTTHCECCGVELTRKESRKPKLTDKHQDHCHDTREIRAVICNACNRIEGLLYSQKHIQCLIEYMEKHSIGL